MSIEVVHSLNVAGRSVYNRQIVAALVGRDVAAVQPDTAIRLQLGAFNQQVDLPGPRHQVNWTVRPKRSTISLTSSFNAPDGKVNVNSPHSAWQKLAAAVAAVYHQAQCRPGRGGAARIVAVYEPGAAGGVKSRVSWRCAQSRHVVSTPRS